MVLIKTPYSYTKTDLKTLSMVHPDNYRNWKKKEYKNVKKNIKHYLYSEQKGICPFCRSKLNIKDKENTTIEHIAPKSKHPKFMFEPRNLAVCCYKCNNSKKNEDTLKDGCTTNTYPKESQCFTIIHPHYDIYSDHVRIEDDIFLRLVTSKAEKTFEIYDLNLLQITEEMIVNSSIQNQPDEYVKWSMQLAKNENNDVPDSIFNLF
ncbi:HNH endonuclease [Methanolobus sp. ZRKC5]|uniref:HNH endonuclease n=1 Tax=unclassified Methanolobus TaxID=2629569 RepID=UPI00313E6475